MKNYFNEMKSKNITIHPSVYTSLLVGLGKAGDIDR
jgi:hypothetical protein